MKGVHQRLEQFSTPQRGTQQVDRQLSFDLGPVKRGIIEDRTAAGEQKPRDRTEPTDAHRAHRKIDIFIRHEVNQSSELCWCVGSRCDFEYVRALLLR